MRLPTRVFRQPCDPTSLYSDLDFEVCWRRTKRYVLSSIAVIPTLLFQGKSEAQAALEPMPALSNKDYGKSRVVYPDFILTASGLQYKDLYLGKGDTVVEQGATVIIDWSGVTLGYYGRPFEARNKPKGSAFSGDEKDFFRFVVGDDSVIAAINEAILGMKQGGIRRIIVPPEIGYPETGFASTKPVPTTFSGRRALDFVLKNQGMMDKTLLFDIEVVKLL